MPSDALPDEEFETETYGCFTGTPTRPELERFFFLDDADKRLIAKRRGGHNQLGFSLQVVTVRYLGTFLAHWTCRARSWTTSPTSSTSPTRRA